MFEIIPAILEKDWAEIEKKLEIVRPFAKSIHIDIIDGKFVNNTTFLDPEPFKKYTKDFSFELHMMVEDPLQYIQPWADAGFKKFIGHVEKMPDQAAFITKAQEVGEAGLALDGPTSLAEIKVPFIDIDTVFVFTAEKVGLSGQTLVADRLEKIKKLAEQTTVPITVDGGINEQNIAEVFNAGARRFGVTSGIFKTADPAASFTKLHDICNSLLG